MIRVAVVIPCYDDPLVVEAIESLGREEPHELVVVDDGSTDHEALRALGALEAAGLKVVRQENHGPAAARMRGVAETSAPYVMPLDSDDRIVPGALARLADALARDERAGFAYGDYALFGEWTGVFRCPRRFSAWTLLYADPYPSCSMVRREALAETGGWDLEGGYEDWDLWLSLVEKGWHGVHAGGTAYERRVHRGRLQADWRRHHRARVALLAERHPALFSEAGRRRLRHEEGPSLLRRLLYPLAARVRLHTPPAVEAALLHALVRARAPF